jgi:tripartite-type tricarboxylate transporter receptor subunit TctC
MPSRRDPFERIVIVRFLLLCLLICSWVSAVSAQTWPLRPVRIVVPYPAGGGVDALTRAVGAELATKWKQPVYIENKGGAGSLIGAETVARAIPDGYTLMATINQTFVGNRFLYKSLPYDPDKSFEAVTMMVVGEQLLLANSALPANSLKEVIALARKEPGKLAYGSYGLGSQPHLLFETIKTREGVDILHVPYKGITPNLAALAGGEVMLGMAATGAAAPLILAGRIKPISVAGPHRVPQFPGVRTTAEEGLAYATASIWFALFAPSGTPEPIIAKIRADVRSILNEPAFTKLHVASQGLRVVAGDGRQLEQAIRDESQAVAEQVKAANVKPE